MWNLQLFCSHLGSKGRKREGDGSEIERVKKRRVPDTNGARVGLCSHGTLSLVLHSHITPKTIRDKIKISHLHTTFSLSS